MRKRFRKITALLISFMLILVMLPAGVVSVSAMSQADFNNRIAEQQTAYPNGSVCYSTQFGQSCFGWAYLIGNNVFGSSPYNWATSYSLSSVKIGDIIQYGNTDGEGHTVFVVGVSGDSITFADCNGNGNRNSEGKYVKGLCMVKWDNYTTISANSLFGYSFSYIKSAPDNIYISQDPPSNPWLSISKDHYDIGETVTFNFGATGATYYIIGINRNGSRIITETIYSGKSYSFNEPGEYTAHVSCCNPYGYSDTNTVSFAVISAPPINPWLNVSKEHYSSGEAVTFTFGATYADYYIIGINKNGNRIITETITSGKSYTFSEQGDYSAHVTCCNSFGYSDTNTVSFTVDSALPKNPWLSISRDCYDCGESVVFSFGATDADYYIIGINKDGSRIITETITSGKSYIFNEEGNYSAHVTCCNAYGYSDTNEVSFAVTSKPPFDPWITTIKKQYLINESVTFNFGATNAYYYFIGINKDGARIITESVPSGKSYSFDQLGKYTAYVSCCNTYGYVDSEKVSFVVYSADDVGDTNLDGYININDVTAIQRHLADIELLTDEQLAVADANGDGVVDINDATYLQMYLAEYNVVLGKQS